MAMVFPVVMYGCESWTVKKAEHWRIDAFELWCCTRLLRVPWTARKSNQSILKEIIPECSFKGLMLRLKLQYFGHLMWRTDSFEKTLIAGSRHIAYWVQHFPQHHLSGSGIAQLEFYHCQEPAWGTPPMTKVMRKEARHTLEILEHIPPNQSLPTFCFVLSPTPLTSWGAVPHYPSLKKRVSLQIQKDDALESAALNMQYAICTEYAICRLPAASQVVRW